MTSDNSNGNTVDGSLVRGNPGALVGREEIDPLVIIDKRNKLMDRILDAALRATHSGQWVNQQGKPFLTSAGAEVMARLRALITAYDDPAKPYVSQARPMFERRWPGDYDHLARVNEWRLAAEVAP